MSANIFKAARGSGSWCLHLLAPMVPIPSGIMAALYSIRSNVPAEQALPQPCFVCVHLHSSAPVVWLLVLLVCSQRSPVSTGLSQATSACPDPCCPSLLHAGTHFTCYPDPGLDVELSFPWTFSASGVGTAV